MWHSAATNFTYFYFLLKIIHAYVSPDIAANVRQDRVDSFDGIKMCSKQIVMFNLSGVLLPLQSQFFFQEFVGKSCPRNLRIGDIMGIKISCGAAKFSGKRNVAELLYLTFYPFDKNHDFFSQH